MSSVKTESTSTRLYSYNKVFGEPATDFENKFEIPKLTVYDQKKTMMCVGYGLASALELLFGKQFSAAWNYGKFRSSSFKGQGLYFMAAVDYLCKIGGVPLADFGAVEEVPTILELVNAHPELLDIAAKYKPSGYCNLLLANVEKRDRCIKDALTRYEEGVAVVATSNRFFGGNHCIAIVGWNDETDSYIFQNSEGIKYGDNGRAEIPKEKIDAICAIFTKPYELPFKDVTKDRWSYGAIKNLYLSEIINGVTEDSFEPERPITREEVAAIIDRVLSKVDKQAARNIVLAYESED